MSHKLTPNHLERDAIVYVRQKRPSVASWHFVSPRASAGTRTAPST
jgi:hypothetical protein